MKLLLTGIVTAATATTALPAQAESAELACARGVYQQALQRWHQRPSKVSSAAEAAQLLAKAVQRGDYTDAQKRASQYVLIRAQNGVPLQQAYGEVDRIEEQNGSLMQASYIPLTVQSRAGCGRY